MKVGGMFIGWGFNDSSDEILRLKDFMRKKFSYAKGLSSNNIYDQGTVDVVVEMQKRYLASGALKQGKFTPGVINYATKLAMGFLPPPKPVDTRPLLITCCGTGVPWWIGPDADTARAVEDRYKWQPIGYPAQPFPMGPSIRAARDEVFNQMNIHRDRIVKYGLAFAGYSQGALALSETWEFEIKPQTGRLHWAYPHIRKAVMWGNPMRERGKAYPDAGGPTALPDSQGVTPQLMQNTPDWFRSYAHRNDLYTEVTPDQSAENKTAIWQIIRDGDIMTGPNSILRQVFELTGVLDGSQVAETTGMVKAMLDALVFFGSGTQPHTNYSTQEAIDYLRAA